MFTSSQLIVLYARLSKDRTGESENVTIQLAEGRDFVEDNGGSVSFEFKDNDISASKYSKEPRPDYDRLVAAVERGEVEIIVGTEMPRLYRRLEELLSLIKLAETTRLRGIWTTDGIGYDLSTPEGIHAAIAAVNNAMLESARISKRTKRKQKNRAKAGKHHGGNRPYCYEGPIKDQYGSIINRDRVNTALIDQEAAIFKSNVDRLINGERAMWVVRDLNTRGIPSAAGGKWTVGNFQRLMVKKRYIIFDDNDPEKRGICEYNGQEYRAEWQGLITREEHDLMMARFKQNSQPWAHGSVIGRSYLLTGFIYCGNCGAPAMGGGRFTRQNMFQRRYGCRRHTNSGESINCGKIFRGADPVEALVTEALFERLDSPQVQRALITLEDDNGQVDELLQKLSHVQQHRQQLVLEYGRGEHKKADYTVMLAAADDTIHDLQVNLNKLRSKRAASSLPPHDTVREIWDDLSLDQKRSIIDLVIERVILHPCHPVRRTWRQWRFHPESVEIVWRC